LTGIFWESIVPTFEDRIGNIKKPHKKATPLPSLFKKFSL
jgi:hypothetical protein